VKEVITLDGTPSGSVDIVNIELWGYEFATISAGPMFKFNPSVSFLVVCDTKERVDAIWESLSKGGTALMELGAYPFAERYGWMQDRYGLSWQVIFRPEAKHTIVPTLLFVGDVSGKAEEAFRFYATVFQDSRVDNIMRYGPGESPDKEGTVRYAGFHLADQPFAAMDSAHRHNFKFNEAISFIVNCETQKELDYYWEKLSAVPSAEQCGWLKDKYGLSWQIVPTIMNELLRNKDPQKLARVTEAFLKMKKFDIETLKRASE
jgi:predicted 3-demethylubiquinone-9 3-methyltransferase (glyoxalase superfamily)